MSEEKNTTQAQEAEAAPQEAQAPPQYPYGYPYPFAMPQGMGMPAGSAQMPQMPYPMFIPVPMYMPYGMPTALPPQGGSSRGAEASPMPLNSYERQSGMQIVYQEGHEQAGMPGGYPFYPMMPPMMPYGYGAPPFAGYGAQQQAPPKPAYEAGVQVLYQETEGQDTEAGDAHASDAPPEGQAAEAGSGSLRDLFEEAEVTAAAGVAEYSEEDYADLFEEPYERRSFSQQLRDLFPRKTDRTGEKVRKSAFLTAVLAIFVTAPILLNSFILGPMKERNELNDAGQLVISSRPLPLAELADHFPGVSFPNNILTQYAAAYAKNSDLRGWLKIDTLDINYPIVQAKDGQYAPYAKDTPGDGNYFYLKNSFTKEPNKHGVPFFDKHTRLEPHAMSKNLVIYGHNNAYVDLVFHNLIRYESVSQWRSEPVISLNTIYGEYLWKIYGVFYSNGLVDHGYIFPFAWSEMSKSENFLKYISEVDRRKLYDTGVDIQADDTLLTLSTCAFNFDGSHFVVVARMVRPGENPNPDVGKAVVNNNPQYPAYYYEKKKRKPDPFSGIANWYYTPDM